jgi:hypothetical protein
MGIIRRKVSHLNFGAQATCGKKATRRKIRKSNVAHRKEILTTIGLSFLTNIFTSIRQKVV